MSNHSGSTNNEVIRTALFWRTVPEKLTFHKTSWRLDGRAESLDRQVFDQRNLRCSLFRAIIEVQASSKTLLNGNANYWPSAHPNFVT